MVNTLYTIRKKDVYNHRMCVWVFVCHTRTNASPLPNSISTRNMARLSTLTREAHYCAQYILIYIYGEHLLLAGWSACATNSIYIISWILILYVRFCWRCERLTSDDRRALCTLFIPSLRDSRIHPSIARDTHKMIVWPHAGSQSRKWPRYTYNHLVKELYGSTFGSHTRRIRQRYQRFFPWFRAQQKRGCRRGRPSSYSPGVIWPLLSDIGNRGVDQQLYI